MTQAQANKAIEEVTEKIVRSFKPQKIVLFGSHAWGKAWIDSDIDLMVVQHSNKTKIERMRDIRQVLFGSHFPPVDVLVYTPTEVNEALASGDTFMQDIFYKGKLLYEQLPAMDTQSRG